MRTRVLVLALAAAVAAVSARGRPPVLPRRAGQDESAMRVLPAAEVPRVGLLPLDVEFLEDASYRWQHMETEHFVLHHDQKMFAARVGRLGEQFYEAIAADLPNLRDRMSPAKSHIFIFRDARSWRKVVEKTPGVDEWAASFVRGPVMYLQETGTASADKMGTLAHEMTHLVVNRFLPIRLPLWLNEGLAEYYGEFAYRSVRGMGQSKRNAFRPIARWTPLPELLVATAYPQPTDAKVDAVRLFYLTSKYVVGFLRLKHTPEQWERFIGRLLAGEEAVSAMLDTYGWKDVGEMERAFSRFVR